MPLAIREPLRDYFIHKMVFSKAVRDPLDEGVDQRFAVQQILFEPDRRGEEALVRRDEIL
jgi:hypothetical protein